MGGLTSRFGMELGMTLPLAPPQREVRTQQDMCLILSGIEFRELSIVKSLTIKCDLQGLLELMLSERLQFMCILKKGFVIKCLHLIR